MSGKNVDKGEAGAAEVRFTVAECTEFHSLGEYYEDIETAEEAAAIYRQSRRGAGTGSLLSGSVSIYQGSQKGRISSWIFLQAV